MNVLGEFWVGGLIPLKLAAGLRIEANGKDLETVLLFGGGVRCGILRMSRIVFCRHRACAFYIGCAGA
ncbi:MAG: hypothetical protein ACI87E_000825 [Mariniblastus sp.]|jgi:hypothetical protein